MSPRVRKGCIYGAISGFVLAFIMLLSQSTVHIPPIIALPVVGPLFAAIGAAIGGIGAKLIKNNSPLPQASSAPTGLAVGAKISVFVVLLIGMLVFINGKSVADFERLLPLIGIWIAVLIGIFIWILA